jgi:hypothetical protein
LYFSQFILRTVLEPAVHHRLGWQCSVAFIKKAGAVRTGLARMASYAATSAVYVQIDNREYVYYINHPSSVSVLQAFLRALAVQGKKTVESLAAFSFEASETEREISALVKKGAFGE